MLGSKTGFAKYIYNREIQLFGSTFEERLDWLTGFYYYNEDAIDDNTVRLASGLFSALEAIPCTAYRRILCSAFYGVRMSWQPHQCGTGSGSISNNTAGNYQLYSFW